MADAPADARLERLEQRVRHDPTSIAFAALAEAYRRLGRFTEAIETSRTGLKRHPAYLSARVTLGRALMETGQLEEAEAELQRVIAAAPENLAAVRCLADVHRRRGGHPAVDEHDRSALDAATPSTRLSGESPALTARPGQPRPAGGEAGPAVLTRADQAPRDAREPSPPPAPPPEAPAPAPVADTTPPAADTRRSTLTAPLPIVSVETPSKSSPPVRGPAQPSVSVADVAVGQAEPGAEDPALAELEQFLAAILAVRAGRGGEQPALR